ncbi:MAG: hypothetical protein ACTS22_00715 [Phycisphaerales bacterium]
MTALLMAAAGTTSPCAAQDSGETVRERVVVTLPSGQRIVRWVEKPAPKAEASSATQISGDPFRGSPANDDSFVIEQGNPEDWPPEFREWFDAYRANDLAADVNGDGRVSPEDYAAWIANYNAQKNDGGSGGGDGGDDDDASGGGGDGGGQPDGGGDGSGGGGESVGWTEFTPSADTIKIYVSEAGSDSNDGRSPQTAVRTVDRGIDLLRDGKPDWLLLRAGDTFRESLGDWKKSGRSRSEPMLVSSYGEGPRPKLLTGTGKGLTMYGYRDFRRHVAFVGLHFEPGVRGETDGISIVSGAVEDILFEDCYIGDYKVNVVVGGVNGDPLEDVRFRRCIIVDAHGAERSHGIYASKLEGLLVEECVIDRNGWDYRRGREATATIWGHNVYIQKTAQGVVARGNISSRSSSHGWQARTGGVQEFNVYAQNPIGLLFANDRSTNTDLSTEVVRGNLVVEGVHTNSSVKRGWGIHLSNLRGVTVTENIIANSLVPDNGWGISVSGSDGQDVRRTVIANNIIDDFGDGIRIMPEVAVDVTLRSNQITRSTDPDLALIKHTRNQDMPGVSYEGNLYSHSDDSSPFLVGSRELTLNEWQADFDPQGGRLLSPYLAEDRSLDSFAQSRGLPDAEALFEAWRSQSKHTWDERITPAKLRDYFAEGFTMQSAS